MLPLVCASQVLFGESSGGYLTSCSCGILAHSWYLGSGSASPRSRFSCCIIVGSSLPSMSHLKISSSEDFARWCLAHLKCPSVNFRQVLSESGSLARTTLSLKTWFCGGMIYFFLGLLARLAVWKSFDRGPFESWTRAHLIWCSNQGPPWCLRFAD